MEADIRHMKWWGWGHEDVTFDDSTKPELWPYLKRELGVDEQPRKLLASVEGLELVDLPHAHDCCGFGGLFAIKNSGISAAMGRAKARCAQQSGAEAIVLCDVSCMTHINGILSREGVDCRAHHIAEILNDHSGSHLRPPTHRAHPAARALPRAPHGTSPTERARYPRSCVR